MAGFKRVPGVPRQAAARNLVIDHLALGVYAARAHARVLAFVVHAGLALNAVGVLDTLWPASCVRIPRVVWQTRAGAGSVAFLADGVRAAWGWIAWQRHWEGNCGIRNEYNVNKFLE